MADTGPVGTIAQALPASIAVAPGSNWGSSRPLKYVTGASGNGYIIDEVRRNLRSYTLAPKMLTSASALFDFEQYFRRIMNAGGIAWIPEVYSSTHYGLLCGPLADGTRTTFSIGVMDSSAVTIFVDGIPQDSSTYTIAKANLIPDDYIANPADADNFTEFNANNYIETNHTLFGTTSLRIEPTGGGTTRVEQKAATTNMAPVVEGRTYMHMQAFYEPLATPRTLSWSFGTRYYDATKAFGSKTTGTREIAPQTWQLHVRSVTIPDATPDIAYALTYSLEGTTDSTTYYHDCFGIAPGTYDTWHLPSQAPDVVEFDSAPSAGSVITATATGKRVTRCRISRDNSWTYDSIGNVSVRKIKAEETPEL